MRSYRKRVGPGLGQHPDPKHVLAMTSARVGTEPNADSKVGNRLAKHMHRMESR